MIERALALRKPKGEMKYNPQGDTLLVAGDVLLVMGDIEKIWKAREAAGESIPSSPG